ncbi:MAG: hypothetical protein OCD76_04295 [Reichenbachiella sp.]
MKKHLNLFLFAILPLLNACDDSDPEIPNEDELITTVELTFTTSDLKGEEVKFIFRDIDGIGVPEYTTAPLSANTSYETSIKLYNEAVDPVEELTSEIEEEGVDHQIFYTPASQLNMNFTYTDKDDNDNPIGLSTSWEIGDVSSGLLVIDLKHQPTKPNDGSSENAGGSTDISIKFPVRIE